MSLRRLLGLLLLTAVAPLCLPDLGLVAQIVPMAGQCGLSPSNPCRPGAYLDPPMQGAVTHPPEAGPFSYVVGIHNNGDLGGDYFIGCTPSSTQVTCSVLPDAFHLNTAESQNVTITYSTLGLGVHSHELEVNATPDDMPGSYTAELVTSFTGGAITVAGASMVQHVWPGDGQAFPAQDTLVATYWHSSGINTAATKLWIDGVDSSAKLAGRLTASGYRVPINPANGAHTWKSKVCAISGRCDEYTTVFFREGPSSFALDDSLPPTVNPLGSGLLLGPLNPPPSTHQGCAEETGNPEISFKQPLGFVTQATPAGRVYVAVIDTGHPTVTIRTETLAWLANQSKTCYELSLLPRSLFDWSYFAALPPNDPHWNSYPYGDLSLQRDRRLDWITGDPMELALGPMPRGPTRAPVPANPDDSEAPLVAPARRTVLPLIPDPGPIDSLSWDVWLNGTQVINNSVPVSGSGVTGIIAGRLNQTANLPITHPSFHTTTNGGWNELVASISDSLGRTTSVRVRFVHDMSGTAGSPGPLAIAAQRDFSHLDQGECAAFGPFQCEGLTLAYAIPGFVTRDRPRDLHLVYRSASQKVRVTVPLSLTIAKSQKAPDSLWVVPAIGGIADSARSLRYAGAVGTVTGPNATRIAEHKDEVRIIAAEVDTAAGQVGIRTVRYGIRSWFVPGVSPAFRDDTLAQAVVQVYLTDTTSTRVGQGWQLAEQGRLLFTGPSGQLQFQGAPAAVWLTGDGSYTIFRKPGSTWVAPAGETARLKQLASAESDGTLYKLFLENGASMGFRADGWQLWTRDLAGNATRFKYNGSTTRVDSIMDPSGKAFVLTYFTTGKRKGHLQEVRVRRSASAADTVTVASFNYDTVSNPNAVRLARFALVRAPGTADTTRFTYRTAAPGAFVDSIIDPRHTASKPVVTRVTWDTELWTPEQVTRPLGGLAQARQIWRRAAPRIGYGRWNRTPTNPLERTLQATQWVGTSVPFAGLVLDYQADLFGGPTYVLEGPSVSSGIMGTNSSRVRHVVRDSIGRPVRIVRNRYDPATADSLIYQYDALGRVTALIRTTLEVPEAATGRSLDTLQFTYDSLTIGASGETWCSRMRTSRDPYRSLTKFEYDSTGNGNGRCLLRRVVGPALDTTLFHFGNNNNPAAGGSYGLRPVKVRDPNGVIDSVAYHAGSWNSEIMVQPMAALTRAYHDGFGRPDSIRDAENKPTWFKRDRTGRVRYAKTGTGANAPVTRTTYDRGGLVTETAVYASATERDTVVPAAAQKTSNYYDQLGRLDSVVNPGGRGISSTGYKARKESWAVFDGHGNPRWEFPGNGSFVSRAYNARGQVTRSDESQVYPGFSADGERFADTAAEAWWTPMGLAVGKVQSAGIIHTYHYDAQGRLDTTASRDPFRPDTSYVNRTYTYSRTGQLRSERLFLNDGTGATVVRWYYYNRRGQRTLSVDTVGAAGVVAEKAGRTEYQYDSVTSRLRLVTGRIGGPAGTPYDSVRYTYDRAGRETQRVVWPGNTIGITTATVYDSLSRVASLSTTGTGTYYSTGSMAYNKVGDLLTYSSTEPGGTAGSHTYTYSTDGTRRLLAAVEGAISNTWSYDALGNRLTEDRGTSLPGSGCLDPMNSVYDADNRILRRTRTGGPTGACPVTRYFTDQAGRRLGERDTTWASPPFGGLKSVLTYTAAGRLYFSVTPSGDLSQNDFNWHWYDGEGRRVMSQTGSLSYIAPFPHPDSIAGSRTYYVYDGNDVALELVRSGSTWSVDRRFLTGGLDKPLGGRMNVAGTYKNITFVADRGGSIVNALESNGAAVSNPLYFPRDAFGGLAGVTGSGGIPLGGVGYTGAGTPNARGGFVYLRNRWYDPTTGRFLTQDPIGLAGGVNLYAYAGNNPITFTDPFGLKTCPPDCPFGTYTAIGSLAGAALGAKAGGITGAILGAIGGLIGGAPSGPGALVTATGGGAGGAAAGSTIGAIGGAAVGGTLGLAVDGILYLKGESAQIGQAIESVMGKKANTKENRDDVGEYCEACKQSGVTGTKNSKGDFTFEELKTRVKEFFNIP